MWSRAVCQPHPSTDRNKDLRERLRVGYAGLVLYGHVRYVDFRVVSPIAESQFDPVDNCSPALGSQRSNHPRFPAPLYDHAPEPAPKLKPSRSLASSIALYVCHVLSPSDRSPDGARRSRMRRRCPSCSTCSSTRDCAWVRVRARADHGPRVRWWARASGSVRVCVGTWARGRGVAYGWARRGWYHARSLAQCQNRLSSVARIAVETA